MPDSLKPLILLILLYFNQGYAYAENVTLPLPTLNLSAEAEYVKGESAQPAILILHGFLTTNQFHTVRSMAGAFQDAGFTTLAPTLTLGIEQRKQSLKCNAIHTHTLQDDVTEMYEWIQWLKNHGHQNVVLVGHSSGSQELLTLLETHPLPEVKLAVFTSLFYLNGEELGTLPSDLARAQGALNNQQNQPQKFSFLFCKGNYYATPESFLSYQKITRQYVLDQLNSLEIPSHTIMGGADKRYQSVGNNWLDEFKNTPTELMVVDGANHFFSSEYEFDLQDRLIDIIQSHFE